MRKFLLLVMVCCALAACSEADKPEGEVIARINDYELTLDEFNKRLAEEARYYDHLNMDRSVRASYLDQAIRKELLIQEAVKRKLDRKEKFMRSIERFWENTLIRDVLEQESEELSKAVYVSEEELEEAYDRIKERDPKAPPFEEMKDKIKERIYDEKVTSAIDHWIETLRKEATIELNKELLDAPEGGAQK